jgi:hypothetical protein
LFVVLYVIAVRFLDRESAPMVVILLATSIPFYNFCLQIRGYILSMLLLSLLVYFLWSGARRRELTGTLICTALLIYTIPTNALFVCGLGLTNLGAMVGASRSVRVDNLKALASLGIGSVLGFLGYLPPVLYRMPGRGNIVMGHFQGRWRVDLDAFRVIMTSVCKAFVANQWLLIVGLVLACLVIVFRRSAAIAPLRGRFFRLVIALFAPFGLLYLVGIGDEFTSRIMVVAAPLFVLLFAASFALVYQGFPILKRAPRVLIVALFIYFNVCFYLNFEIMERRALLDIASGKSSQNLYQNFYLARYHISGAMAQLNQLLRQDSIPVILYRHNGIGTECYLKEYGIPYTAQEWNQFKFVEFKTTLDHLPRAYVLTLYPNTFAADLLREMPEYRFTRVSPQWDYHDLFLLERRAGATRSMLRPNRRSPALAAGAFPTVTSSTGAAPSVAAN